MQPCCMQVINDLCVQVFAKLDELKEMKHFMPEGKLYSACAQSAMCIAVDLNNLAEAAAAFLYTFAFICRCSCTRVQALDQSP